MRTIFGNNSRKRHPSIEDLINIHNSGSEFTHAYETLINNLNIINGSHPAQTLLVTSSQPLEGKTTVATNLAVAMMLAKKKTLIVDTDLRRPSLHDIFEIENDVGFANILLGTDTVKELIHSIPIFENFEEDSTSISVMPSGQANKNLFKQIDPEKIKTALNKMKDMFDVIILDSSPVLAVTDSLLIAPLVQDVILVLNTGVVKEEDVVSAKNLILKAGGKITGVVMNNFNEKQHGAGIQPYSRYYNYNR